MLIDVDAATVATVDELLSIVELLLAGAIVGSRMVQPDQAAAWLPRVELLRQGIRARLEASTAPQPPRVM